MMPVHHPVGTKVIITEENMQIMRNANRCRSGGITWLSDGFLAKMSVGMEGIITHTFLPSYDVTVQFGNQSFHMKDHYFTVIK